LIQLEDANIPGLINRWKIIFYLWDISHRSTPPTHPHKLKSVQQDYIVSSHLVIYSALVVTAFRDLESCVGQLDSPT
ncbi:hypothetical protein BgiBS90_009463, partial [Biomphalaria glabrata]